ncbi:GNAT family N-acetyltransferase [Amycolatopsis jiangsuensis]|uniref:Putative GNAT family acetyltransferase n=1 Tax=Amycolatopsis jiangsuensis TaxID=1181879 RepID=A0A840IYA2_9PSEU|nr:GNAT family N-acetyltransferase [Amycolatopsis jiangsuensis]MBB4685844.1 putative GNAT family acetyltransferase [Amycolatopsis jiangsuensis]
MSEETRVVRNDERNRYELYAGGELAGFAEFTPRGRETTFTHTEIGDEFGGRGLAKVLASEALDDVVARGGTIVPICPFIAGFLRKNEGYAEHVRWPGR